MRKVMVGAAVAAMLLGGMAVMVSAQGPGPGPFGRGPGGPGGPMPGMFEFGGLMGGFGGSTVSGKPVLATFTITHTETLPGNSITNTTTGTFARGADGSTYRDVKLAGIGPWAASGKPQEFIYIRNVTKGTEYIVNVTKGTYEAFPIHQHTPPAGAPAGGKGFRANRAAGANREEVVNDNPSATFKDPAGSTVYTVDDRKASRTIKAGTIGNQNDMVVSSERMYSSDLQLVLQNSHSDPRFGTTTYQLSNITNSPSDSLFTPNPSFTQVQRKFGRGGHHGPPGPPPAAPSN